jgi:hypothetical protein
MATVDHRCAKTNDHAVAAAHSVDHVRWQEAFESLMGRIAGRLARVEPRRRARDLVLGLLSQLPRKNCWAIAEWAAAATPRRTASCTSPVHERATRIAAAGRWPRPAITADKPRISDEDHDLRLEY